MSFEEQQLPWAWRRGLRSSHCSTAAGVGGNRRGASSGGAHGPLSSSQINANRDMNVHFCISKNKRGARADYPPNSSSNVSLRVFLLIRFNHLTALSDNGFV